MHYPNLTFHGVEAIRIGFNTLHPCIYEWQAGGPPNLPVFLFPYETRGALPFGFRKTEKGHPAIHRECNDSTEPSRENPVAGRSSFPDFEPCSRGSKESR
jgi:hypothetical protein